MLEGLLGWNQIEPDQHTQFTTLEKERKNLNSNNFLNKN